MREVSGEGQNKKIPTASHSDFVSGGQNAQGGSAWFDLAKLYAFHNLREDVRIGESLLPLEYLVAPAILPHEERSRKLVIKEGRRFISSLDQLAIDSLRQMLILIDETIENSEVLNTTFSSDSKFPNILQPKSVRLRFWRDFVDNTLGPVEYRMLDKA
jgi:hypothetical protein